jgi:hypothetical protein
MVALRTSLAFHRDRCNHQSRFAWEVSRDGSYPHPVVPRWNTPPDEASYGQWTPDGRYYIFYSGKSAIWALGEKAGLFDKRASEPVLLTTGLQPVYPALSPDGKRLFVVSKENRGDLVHYEAKSSGFEPLSARPLGPQA